MSRVPSGNFPLLATGSRTSFSHQRRPATHSGGKTSLMISPRHVEGRKVAAVVRQKLKAEGVIGAEDHAFIVLRRMDLGSEARRDLFTLRAWTDSKFPLPDRRRATSMLVST
jgi:hypothetical protein